MKATLLLRLGAVVLAAAVPVAAFSQNSVPGTVQGSVNDRIGRIRKLGKTDSQAIPVIAQSLSDPDPDVRQEAVRAIVKIGTERSLDPLAQATADNDGSVAMLATDGLVNFYLPGYVSNGLLSHPLSRGVRRMKDVFSVRDRHEISPDIPVRPSVQTALSAEVAHAPSMEARANAARAAGILHDTQAVTALESALRSKDTDLMLEALYALQKIGDPAAGPSVRFLVRDLDNRVQMAALETVGLLRDLPAAPDIRNVLRDARNEKIRRTALMTLALLGIPGDRPLFQQYASDSDGMLRAAALEGLGRIREPEDGPLLDTAFNEKDVDWRVHLAAAFALVDEGKVDTGEFSPLRYLVENLDQANRDETAAAYLTELCRRDDVRKAVYGLLTQATAEEKVALCTILGNTHADDVVPVLQTLQSDSNADVALAAAKGIRIAQTRRP